MFFHSLQSKIMPLFLPY